MQLIIEPTTSIETIEGVPCRRWEGTTNTGVPVHVWVRTLSPQTDDAAAIELFDRELKALPPARREAVSYDLRFFTD